MLRPAPPFGTVSAVVLLVKRAFSILSPTLFCLAALWTADVAAAEPFSVRPNPGNPPATAGMAIAAVVNEDIITMYDVQSRLDLLAATSGAEITPDIRQRLLPQIIDALIDERLKLQEAAHLKIKTSEIEVRQAVDNIEQRNNMQPGAFRALLESRGVDMGSLYGQIEADVAWVKVVRQSLQEQAVVGQDEVFAVLKRAQANQGKPEYLLSEIVLPVLSPAQETVIREMADRLVKQAREGAPFQALAQQFSQSPTAALGGDLGWVVRGDMEPELDDAVSRLEAKQVSEPIRTSTGYHILAVRERRSSGAPDPNMTIVTLSQIYLPNEGGRNLGDARIAQLTSTISAFTTCDEMNKLAAELKTPGSGPIQPVYVGALPPKIRDVVSDLKPGRVSAPVEVGGARLLIQVCMRRDDSGVPSPDQIMGNLENDKLQNAARQRLRDLRRAALIDIRM